MVPENTLQVGTQKSLDAAVLPEFVGGEEGICPLHGPSIKPKLMSLTHTIPTRQSACVLQTPSQ
jgi:hypothetical protein